MSIEWYFIIKILLYYISKEKQQKGITGAKNVHYEI